MKKLLLLLAGLLFAVLPSAAQITYAVNQNGITKGEDLTSGDYLIYVIPDGTKTPGYVHYSTTGVSGRHYLTYPLNISSGIVSDPMYIWTVTKTPQNNFEVVLKSDPTKFWIDDVKWGQNMTGSQNKAVLITEDSEQGIKFRPAEEMKDNSNITLATNTYMNCNGPIGENNAYTSLSYWGGSNGAATFIFYKVTETEASEFPFVLSDAPTSSSFAENTYWYYLTLRKLYATHFDNEENIPLTSYNPVKYGSFWAFVKTESGAIEIYNAATGPKKVLASDAPEVNGTGTGGDKTTPIMIDKEELGTKTGAWSIKVGDDNTFYLKREGQTEDYYLNDRSGTLAFWSNSASKDDGGSQFRVSLVDIPAVIKSTREFQKAATGVVGALIGESYAEFNKALDKGTAEGLFEALKIRDITGTIIPLDPNKYYRLQNVMRDGVLQINTQSGENYKKLSQSTMDKTNANMLWKVEMIDDIEDGVKLYHVNAGEYAGNPGNTTLSKTGAEYIKVDWGAANFGFKQKGTNNYLVQFSGGGIGSWSDGGKGSDHAWYIMPAEDIELNISAAGYATVNYPFAVQLPAELTAYTGTANAEKSKFMLEEVSGGAVPANTPVVIQGTAGPHTLTIDYANTADKISSDLSGSLLPIEITPDDYILAQNGESVGFYKTTDGGTLAQNKAYIKSTSAIQAVRGFSFSTEGDGTTGIENTVTETENEEYYDLQGRRVLNPTKGIYVTKSGKKVLFVK